MQFGTSVNCTQALGLENIEYHVLTYYESIQSYVQE